MTDRISDSLSRLNLSGVVIGPSERLAWPKDTVDQARGVGPVVLASALLTGSPPATIPASVRLLSDIGIELRVPLTEPRILKFSSSGPQEAIRVQLVDPAGGAVSVPPNQPDVAVVDSRRSGPFLIAVSRGMVLCTPTDAGLSVQQVIQTTVLQPLEQIAAPLDTWLSDCTDSWLVNDIRSLIRSGDSWSVGVAAGRYARLTDPESSAMPARSRIEAMLRGEVDGYLARPRVWVRSLTLDKLSTLQRLAMAEVDRIQESLDRVAIAAEAQTSGWNDDWIDVCRARDDLEGVDLLLRESGSEGPLAEALAVLDREGRLTRMGIPLHGLPTDEQLVRARRLNPDAWWVAVR